MEPQPFGSMTGTCVLLDRRVQAAVVKRQFRVALRLSMDLSTTRVDKSAMAWTPR